MGGKLNLILHFFTGKLVQTPSLRTLREILKDIINIGEGPEGVESTKVLEELFGKLASQPEVGDELMQQCRVLEGKFKKRTPRENLGYARRPETPKKFPSLAQTPTLPNPYWDPDSGKKCNVPGCGKPAKK